MIPNRISYHRRPLEVPSNLVVHDKDENDEQIQFTLDCAEQLVESLRIDEVNVRVARSDGSGKNDCGGAGYFACPMTMMHKVDYQDLIQVEMDEDHIDEVFDGQAQFGTIAVSRRASIEHGELTGAAKLCAVVSEI